MLRGFILLPGFVVACASTAPTSRVASPAPSVSVVPSAAPRPVGSATDAPGASWPATAVKAPVFSDDDCAADADCVPIATCHPASCVGPGKAGTLPPGTMCTMDCRGGTLDCSFNHCGCAANAAGQKQCAVLPGGLTAKP